MATGSGGRPRRDLGDCIYVVYTIAMDNDEFDDLLDEYLCGRCLPNPSIIRYPNRTIFWGATRSGRWLFVSCEDCREAGKRILKPITAFEPEEGEDYWRKQ